MNFPAKQSLAEPAGPLPTGGRVRRSLVARDWIHGQESSRRLLRFLFVGVLNTAFGYGLFAAIYATLHSYRAAIVIATACGVLFNFFTSGRLVFASAALSRLVPFVLGYGVVLTVNVALLDIGVRLGISPFLGQVLVLPLTVGLAFLINDRFVFWRTR